MHLADAAGRVPDGLLANEVGFSGQKFFTRLQRVVIVAVVAPGQEVRLAKVPTNEAKDNNEVCKLELCQNVFILKTNFQKEAVINPL